VVLPKPFQQLFLFDGETSSRERGRVTEQQINSETGKNDEVDVICTSSSIFIRHRVRTRRFRHR
jgi:hypothetical protein